MVTDDGLAPDTNVPNVDDTWCLCIEPMNEYYVPDGVNEECYKHHWRCGTCHKIVQTG